MRSDETIAALLDQLDATHARVRELVSGRDDADLASRPANGNWSVLENVRHLLFAEEAHLGQFVPGGIELSTIGLATTPLAPKLPRVGSTPPSTVREVLDSWTAVHARVVAALSGPDTQQVRYRLGRHLNHQRRHVAAIERLLRAQARAVGARRV